MMKLRATPDDVVVLLNELLELDRSAITKLCDTRIECNKNMAIHQSLQVRHEDGLYKVGLIGVLNGIFGRSPKGKGFIIAKYCNGSISHFFVKRPAE